MVRIWVDDTKFPQSWSTPDNWTASKWDLANTLAAGAITPAYIDTLIQENTLAQWSIDQLKAIKDLIQEHQTNLTADRLTIKNNLVCINGYTIPASKQDCKKMNYWEMKNNLHPAYAEALLSFTATCIWTVFNFPSDRNQLETGEIDGHAFLNIIDMMGKNKGIIKNLTNIIWFAPIIPVGQYRNKSTTNSVIYLDEDCFSSYVPSIITLEFDNHLEFEVLVPET
jgi:hypothetical protein